MITCTCPQKDPLPTIDAVTCAERFGQTQKLIFQRLLDNHGEENYITNTEAVTISAWGSLKESGDSTQICVTPFVTNPTTDGGDVKTTGDGNEALNGIGSVVGSNPVNFSCRLENCPQDRVASLKSLICEALGGNLGVYLINENGQIKGIKTTKAISNVSTDVWMPIPIRAFFVSDEHLGGLDANDYNDLSFKFVPNYSDKTAIITLNASALSL